MRRHLVAGLSATALLGLTACSGSGGVTPSETLSRSVTDGPAASEPQPEEDLPPISDARLRFGLALAEGPTSDEVRRLSESLGESPAISLFFKDFAQDPPLHELDIVAARGSEPVISWEPWVWDEGVDQPEFRLDEITAGAHDDVLDEWGAALATWGRPLTLRFGHEMNGSWYPWAESENGNGTGDYIKAFRHVHDRVKAAGADNVRWMWSPNSRSEPAASLARYYPGDDYVDVVGLDGYNWGTTKAWSWWQKPDEIFDSTLANVRTIAPGKPIILAETSSVTEGGDRKEWARQLIEYADKQKDVSGVVWFHSEEDVDWRLDDATLSALKSALGRRKD
ncbi:glycoside hydrolase family 26 protein [Janibacter sp. G1551]|uniref:glycoside hydrolase family 26 protein n=1 Tax=Janibacter sp. G1551 TaxID=3420440 RepID=UPI003D0742A9